MAEPTLTCPNCKTEIKLTESLAAPLLATTRAHYEQQLTQKDADISAREAALRERSAEIAKEKLLIDEQIAVKLADGRQAIAAEEARKARLLIATDLNDKAEQIAALQQVLQQQEVKLAEAQQAQAELLRKQRDLDDARREVDLTVEKRVQEGLEAVREMARKQAEQPLQLKVREKEEQISSMQRQIDELKRKAEQGSQQLQGEAQELQLEELLRSKFPRDNIEAVAKGEFGGDLLHRVFGPTSQQCGTILWETKRTKNCSDGWLPKVRHDQREAKADIAFNRFAHPSKGVDRIFRSDRRRLGDRAPMCNPCRCCSPRVFDCAGWSPSSRSWAANENGNGLPVPNEFPLPTSCGGDRGEGDGYANGPRPRTKSDDKIVGQARGANQGCR
jgi:hypothetical protein